MVAATAFKILTTDQWLQFEADGVFAGAAIDVADGYIHLSTSEQLAETLDKYFAGQQGLMIAEIDLSCFADTLKWEPSRGGDLFPHIYEKLQRSSVIGIVAHPLAAPLPFSLAKLHNVGKAALHDFAVLNIVTVAQLSACNPDTLFVELEHRSGQRQDPCVHDVFTATIHQARTGEARDWWTFTAARKARNAV